MVSRVFQDTPSVNDAINKTSDAEKVTTMTSYIDDEEMSYFPIEIERVVFKHKDGTKFYRLTKIFGQTGEHLLIFQFGSVLTAGQIKIKTFTDRLELNRFFEKKIDERLRRGYSIDPAFDPAEKTVEDFQKMKDFLGVATIAKIGKSNLLKLIPGLKGMDNASEYTNPRLNEEGRIDPAEAARKAREAEERAEKLRKELKAKEENERKQRYADNATYGMF